MNFNQVRGPKGSSPSQRSLTPTMLIESPKVTLANYRLMIKKSKEKPRVAQSGGLSSGLIYQGFPSMSDSITSTDTCIFSSALKNTSGSTDDLRNQLEDMQKFTKNALDAQRKYFEDIILGLEQEIQEEKTFFDQEISIIRDEISYLREERDDLSTIVPESPSCMDYKTQYFKNQEFISILERQNKILYEKIIGDMGEKNDSIRK